MTPDEMKILARVANRNTHEESPIVLNDSRVIDIPSFELPPLTLEEKVNQLMLNVQEAQQALQPNNDNAYGTILGDMADQVEKNRADVVDIKNTIGSLSSSNNFDELNLSSVDVLLDVKKAKKLDNNLTSEHSEYTNILSHFGIVTPATYSNTKAYYINNLETPPLNALDLESVDGDILPATRINKVAVKLGEDITVGSINKVQLSQKRSDLPKFTSLYTGNILPIDFVVDNDSAKTLIKVVSYNIYSSISSGDLTTTFLYLKTVGTVREVWKHSAGVSTTLDAAALTGDLNSGASSGIYYFSNGYLVNLTYTSPKFTLSGAGVSQNVGSNTLYGIGGGDKYVFKALNTIGVYDSGFSNVQMLKSESTLDTPLPIAGITRTNKLITISTAGVATQLTAAYNAGDNLFKITVSGLLRICKSGSSGVLTALQSTDYVLDKSSLKVQHNTASGVSNIADGFYMGGLNFTHNGSATSNAINTKLFRFINGEINYAEFGVVGSLNNKTGTIYFADEKPEVADSDTTNSPITQTYTLPDDVINSTNFLDRAITLAAANAVTALYYVGADSKLRKVSDNSVVTSVTGFFKVSTKYYNIVEGVMTLYSGLVFDKDGAYNNVLLGVATSLPTGIYVDNNDRVISVTSGAWNASPTGGLNNDYIRITDNNSFIIRKLVVQSDKDIFLLAVADEYTDANALVNIETVLYRIPAFNQPVVKATNTYFKYTNDDILRKSALITASISTATAGLYSWNADNANRIHQVKSSGQICWINGGNFDTFTYGTSNVLYPLFIEKLPHGPGTGRLVAAAGRLFKFDPLKGALGNLPANRWFLPNYFSSAAGSSLSSILSFGSAVTDIDTTANTPTAGVYRNMYFNIDSDSNKPISARLLRSDQASAGTFVIYLLNEFGMAATEIGGSSGIVYITRPDNSLEYWNNGVKSTLSSDVADINYISHDDKLSKTSSASGARGSIYTDNYWVKLATDNTHHLFVNGIEVIPTAGKMINVNTESTVAGYVAENGLKIFRRNAANNANAWASQISSIDSISVSDNAVTTAKLAAGAVTDAKLASGAALANLAAGSVTAAKLASDVPSFKIVVAGTTNAELPVALGSIVFISAIQTSGVFSAATANEVYMLKATGATTFANWIKLN
jgi:hypothetical protein